MWYEKYTLVLKSSYFLPIFKTFVDTKFEVLTCSIKTITKVKEIFHDILSFDSSPDHSLSDPPLVGHQSLRGCAFGLVDDLVAIFFAPSSDNWWSFQVLSLAGPPLLKSDSVRLC